MRLGGYKVLLLSLNFVSLRWPGTGCYGHLKLLNHGPLALGSSHRSLDRAGISPEKPEFCASEEAAQ